MKRFLAIVLFVALAGAALGASQEFFPKPSRADLPIYPEQARLARVAGIVRLWFVVDENGDVSQAGVVTGNPLLRDASLNNVKSWKFRTGSMKSRMKYETEFEYKLNVQQRSGEPRLTVSMADFRRIEVVSELYIPTIE